MSRSGYLYVDPTQANAHLWRAVAPFVTLEEQLFAHDRSRLDECTEAFVEAVLPEATLLGRVA